MAHLKIVVMGKKEAVVFADGLEVIAVDPSKANVILVLRAPKPIQSMKKDDVLYVWHENTQQGWLRNRGLID
jgi:hypothetical protein